MVLGTQELRTDTAQVGLGEPALAAGQKNTSCCQDRESAVGHLLCL